jgi:DNA-binding GntR family transcriptional regulator
LEYDLPHIDDQGTIGDQLYGRLEEAIIDGRIAPGDRIHADELAEHFGVSRIPVREALRALHANGWLEIRPRRETLVAKQTPEELADLFEVRLLLDVESARLAAKRRTDDDLAALEALVKMGRRSEGKDPGALSPINEQFHVSVARAAKNRVLDQVTQSLAKRVRWYFGRVVLERGSYSVGEHEDLLEAIRLRDGDRAAKIAEAHVLRTQEAARSAVIGVDQPKGA